MEFPFNIKNVATEGMVKIDYTLMPIRHAKNDDLKNCLGKIIDDMGKTSAVAQELKTPVTSADKLVNSDHIIYMLTEHDKPGHFTVVGILKMG